MASSWPGYHERVYLTWTCRTRRNPQKAGIWHIPGTKDGEVAGVAQLPGQHAYVHGIIPEGNRAYVSIVDGGMAIVDITDVAHPQTISHINWFPPFGGYDHTSMPLPSRGLVLCVCESVKETVAEDGDKRIWVMDVREERQPVISEQLPAADAAGGLALERTTTSGRGASGRTTCTRTGPHYGYRSEHLIFSTWYNAGLRITDLSNPDRRKRSATSCRRRPRGRRRRRSTTCSWTSSA